MAPAVPETQERREAVEWLERYASSYYKNSAHAQTILIMLGEKMSLPGIPTKVQS